MGDARRHLHVFRIAAPGIHAEQARCPVRLHADDGAAHHAIADLAIGHARSDRGDHATGIDAEHVRQRRPSGVEARAHHEIERAVDRNAVDLDQHLARSGLGCRHILEPHHVRRSEFADHDGPHRVLPHIDLLFVLARRLSPIGLAGPLRLRVSTDEAALGAYQPAARLLDGLAGLEQVELQYAAVKTALRPGSAPHARSSVTCWSASSARVGTGPGGAWTGILRGGSSRRGPLWLRARIVHPFAASERPVERWRTKLLPCAYPPQSGDRVARLRLGVILTGAMVLASDRAGAQGGSTYVRQT